MSAAPQDKRDAILEAALELFAERGFHGTAVPLVADRAKVGAGTIYRYFPSKEALVNALYQRHKGAFGEAILTGFPVDAPFREQFHHFWSRACAFAAENPRALEFLELHHHGPYLDPSSRAMELQLLGTAKSFVETAIAAQILKPIPAEVLMAIVWGSFRALVQGGCEKLLTFDDATAAQAESCLWEALRR
jgi:AcrR family transcriptional regulator